MTEAVLLTLVIYIVGFQNGHWGVPSFKVKKRTYGPLGYDIPGKTVEHEKVEYLDNIDVALMRDQIHTCVTSLHMVYEKLEALIHTACDSGIITQHDQVRWSLLLARLRKETTGLEEYDIPNIALLFKEIETDDEHVLRIVRSHPELSSMIEVVSELFVEIVHSVKTMDAQLKKSSQHV